MTTNVRLVTNPNDFEIDTDPNIGLKLSSRVNTLINNKENASNKDISTSLGTSNDKYPSQNAVKTYVDTTIAAATQTSNETLSNWMALKEEVANRSDNTLLNDGYGGVGSPTIYPTQNAVKTYVDVAVDAGKSGLATSSDLSTIAALKEDVINRSDNTGLSDGYGGEGSPTIYPTQNAVKTYVDAAIVEIVACKGVANGFAGLDSNTLVPFAQLPVRRTVSAASSATPTPNVDTTDMYVLTALAATATFGVPTGTPVDGQKLMIRIKDNGTSRTLSWNSIYTAVGITLPTATTANKYTYVGMVYNSQSAAWDCIATATQS